MESQIPCELQFLVYNCKDEKAMVAITSISLFFYIMQLGLLGFLVLFHLKDLAMPFRVFAVGWLTHTLSRLVYLPLLLSGIKFGAHMSEMADLGCVTALCVIVEYASAVSKAIPLADFIMPRRWQYAVETFRKGWVRVLLFLALFTPNTVLAIISGVRDDPRNVTGKTGGVYWAHVTKANYLASLTLTFIVTVVISLATFSIVKEAQSKSRHDPSRFGKLATTIWMVFWFSSVSAFLVFAFIILIAIYAFVPFRHSLAAMAIMGTFWHIFLPLFYNFAFLAAIVHYRSEKVRIFILRLSGGDATMLASKVTVSISKTRTPATDKRSVGDAMSTTPTKKDRRISGGMVYLEDCGAYVMPSSEWTDENVQVASQYVVSSDGSV